MTNDVESPKPTNTPFVRFRHGLELRIESNIKESLKTFIQTYQVISDEAFKSLIKDISDGSGLGISKESTWTQAIKELFNIVRDYDPKTQKMVKYNYIEILKILSSDNETDIVWENIKSFFETNLDVLSLWEFSPQKHIFNCTEAYRDANGKIYEKTSLGVEILDGKTLSEARYDYTCDDCCSKYGSIGLLLRLTRLVFIENELLKNSGDYSHVRFVMSDDGYNTWYLQGYWQVKTLNTERYIKWHPKSCFTDISWLESDLLINIAKLIDLDIKNECDPSSPIRTKPQDTESFKKSIQGFNFQYEVALDTNVFITNDRDEILEEVYVEFESRTLRWINGSIYRCPVLIIPTNNSGYKDAMDIAKKFISLLIFDNSNITIKEGGSVGHAIHYYPAMIHQPRLPSITTISSTIINHAANGNNQNKWLVLSYYKEAKNSDSIFYKFLNYYKIIQRAFLKPNGAEDPTTCISWINSELLSRSQDQEIIDIVSDSTRLNLSIGVYLQHTCRDAASHVGRLDKRIVGGYPTINPDDPSDSARYQRATSVIESLARKTIDTSMHS